ncbi:MAG: TrmB family transcriptional regulator [Thaumarchaeota archaeon]|nr:TrmB family transcriptional regulator [Nitrososphaerota archaeon]
MVKENGLTVSLEEFGLSKYEAKAYVTLVSHGTISASEVAYYSNLPRTKIYPTLLKLEKKRLVIISKSKPIMCTAIAPEDAFDDIIQEHIDKVNQMNTLVSKLKRASEESKKTRGAEEKRYFHINSNNVLNQLKIMTEGTKSSIQATVDSWGLNLLAECKEQLLLVLRRNVDVKIIVAPSQIGSESFYAIPDGAKIRVADTVQNSFIFDQTEVLLIDGDNGKGAVFSATDVLGSSQAKVFSQMWENALKTDGLYDMAKSDAQSVYRIIQLVSQNGLGFTLNSAIDSKNSSVDFLKLLEKEGINLKSKSFEDVTGIINSVLQITCAGHLSYDSAKNNITVESKINGGHSLPWTSMLDQYLQSCGYNTKLIYQNHSQKGEKVFIKIHPNKN